MLAWEIPQSVYIYLLGIAYSYRKQIKFIAFLIIASGNYTHTTVDLMKRIKHTIPFIVTIILLLTIAPKIHAQVNTQDSLALVDLYNSTGGPNWTFSSGWPIGNPRGWSGILVDSNNRVVSISLPSNNLTGIIPPSVGNLAKLQYINLSNNQLTGRIPSSMGNLTQLKSFSLDHNQLRDTIPASLGNLHKVGYFNLAVNALTGNIPPELGNLLQVYNLLLEVNKLTGPIPTSLGKLTKLTRIELENNQLTGTIPSSLGGLDNLQELNLSFNQLSGTIPDSLGSAKHIIHMYLSGNQLTGTIPLSFGRKYTPLNVCMLDNNHLSGGIPDTIIYNRETTFWLENNNYTFYKMENYVKNNGHAFYNPQLTIPLHRKGKALFVSVGGTPADNTYKWFRKGKLVATKVGDSTFYPTDSLQYNVEVTNAVIANLTLYSDTLSYTTFPTIASFTPDATCPGTSVNVYIRGTNFLGSKGVSVGGVAVDSFSIINKNVIIAYVSRGVTGDVEVASSYGIANSDSVFSFGREYHAFAYIPNEITNTVSVIDLESNRVTKTIKVGKKPIGVVVSRDNKKVYIINNEGGTVSVIDVPTNSIVATIKVGILPVDMCLNKDGSVGYVANYFSGEISIINTATNTVTSTFPLNDILTSLRLSPDDTTLYVTNGSTNKITVINLVKNKVTTTIPVDRNPDGIAISLDTTKMYVTNYKSNLVDVVNIATNNVINSIQVGGGPQTIVRNIDGNKLYVGNWDEGTVSVINTTTEYEINRIAIGGNPSGFSLSADGTKLYTTNYGSNHISIINTATDKVIDSIYTDKGSTSTGEYNFIVDIPSTCAIPPFIGSFTASACPGGSDTIKGIGFTGTTTVRFGNDTARLFSVLSDTTIVAIVDTGASGSVSVTNTLGTASLGGFTYLTPTTSLITKSICQGSTYTFNGHSYSQPNSYTIHLTNTAGCDSAITLVLSLIKPIVLQAIQGENTVCVGDSIQLTDGIKGGVWYSEKSKIATVDTASGYLVGRDTGFVTIDYTDTLGCSKAVSHIVEVLGVPLHLFPTTINASCENTGGGSLLFDVINAKEGPYQVDYQGVKYDLPSTFSNLPIGTYSFAIYNRAGCTVESLPNVRIGLSARDANCDTLFVPSAFVPVQAGSTGYTTVLKPYGGGISIQSLSFKVFNRYGKLVFETHQLDTGWNGLIDGVPQDTGTYVWMLTYTPVDGKPKTLKGTSVLLR